MKTKLAIVGTGALVTFGLAAGPVLASTAPSGAGQRVTNIVQRAASPVVGALALRSTPSGSSPAPVPSAGSTVGSTVGSATSSVSGQVPTGTPVGSAYPSMVRSAASGSQDYNSSTGAYTPPLHGTSPHGEGTGLALTTEPRSTPDTSNCDHPSSDEIAVVGRSCGQQSSDGSYSGHVTILALGGQELLGENSTASGTTTTGSLAPLAGPVLSQLNGALAQFCSSSNGQACLSLLKANSSSSSTGSSNSFQAADASLGGASGLSASALSSNGNISQTSTCQTASGSSSVADLSAGGTSLVSAAESADSSRACQNPSQNSQSASSHVLGGAIASVTSPLLGGTGCADGTPNTPVKPLGQIPLPPQVVAAICNATDSNGSQASAPYGTNDGLTAILLGSLGVQAPNSESLARAPSAAPPATPPGSGVGSGPGAPPAAPAAAPVAAAAAAVAPAAASGQLPFTGINLMLELMIAFCLLAAGAAAWLASRRRSA